MTAISPAAAVSFVARIFGVMRPRKTPLRGESSTSSMSVSVRVSQGASGAGGGGGSFGSAPGGGSGRSRYCTRTVTFTLSALGVTSRSRSRMRICAGCPTKTPRTRWRIAPSINAIEPVETTFASALTFFATSPPSVLQST